MIEGSISNDEVLAIQKIKALTTCKGLPGCQDHHPHSHGGGIPGVSEDDFFEATRLLFEDGAEPVEPTKQREGDQALPKGGQECVQDLVIAEMQESKRVGLERYGSVLMTFNGRRSIQDVAEEVRDLHVYLTQVKAESQATRETLVEVVTEALNEYLNESDPSDSFYPKAVAETAVDAIMGWVVGNHLMRTKDDPVSVVVERLHWAAHEGGVTNLELAQKIVEDLG